MTYYTDAFKKAGECRGVTVTDVWGELIFYEYLTSRDVADLELYAILYASSVCNHHDTIRSDSLVAVNYVNRTAAGDLRRRFLIDTVRRHVEEKGITVEWVPRGLNMAGAFNQRKRRLLLKNAT
jgi:hypothetical protein